ncbi:MAG: hypothetical protein HUJ42_03045 [Malacoplasma sp.]|nr:hypothetical protein [Malacoplasma sp.]
MPKKLNDLFENDETNIEETNASEKEFLGLVRGSKTIILRKCKVTKEIFEDENGNVFEITRFKGGIEFMKTVKLSEPKDPIKLIFEMMKDFKDEMTNFRNDMNSFKDELNNLRSDMNELRTDVNGIKADMNELRSDVNALKADVNNLRSEMQKGFSEVNAEITLIKEDISVLKKDVAVLKKDVSVLKEDVADIKQCPTIQRELKEIRKNKK